MQAIVALFAGDHQRLSCHVAFIDQHAAVLILAGPGPLHVMLGCPHHVMLGLDPSICRRAKAANCEHSNDVWVERDARVEPEHDGGVYRGENENC